MNSFMNSCMNTFMNSFISTVMNSAMSKATHPERYPPNDAHQAMWTRSHFKSFQATRLPPKMSWKFKKKNNRPSGNVDSEQEAVESYRSFVHNTKNISFRIAQHTIRRCLARHRRTQNDEATNFAATISRTYVQMHTMQS